MSGNICCVCGVREATQLCDYAIGVADPRRGAETAFTCDAPLCKECKWEPWHTLHGHDWDFCPEHTGKCGPVDCRTAMTEERADATRREIHARCKRPPRLHVVTGEVGAP